MTEHAVTDDQMERLVRMQDDLARKVREGALDPESVMHALQHVIEGDFGACDHDIVDCDADPFVPVACRVETHRKMGRIDLGKVGFGLFLTEAQERGEMSNGLHIDVRLRDEPVLNANVLVYLLEHPRLIPEEWKGKNVMFWGTTYRCADGFRYVCDLYWSQDEWRWSQVRIDVNHGARYPAAVILR